jgi:hypothetical protein
MTTRTHAATAGAVPRFARYRAALRRRWGRPTGGPFWDEIEPAFRFGWDAAHDATLARHSWDQVEADLAGHWYAPESPSEEMAWDQVREAVRLGWEAARRARSASTARAGSG